MSIDPELGKSLEVLNTLQRVFAPMAAKIEKSTTRGRIDFQRLWNEVHYREVHVHDPKTGIAGSNPDFNIFRAVAGDLKNMQEYSQTTGPLNKKLMLGEVPSDLKYQGVELVRGMTPGMIAASKGTPHINVFKRYGGEFDLARDDLNRDAGWFAAKHSLAAMKSFVEAGGKFTNAQVRPLKTESGAQLLDSTLMLALRHGVEGGKLYFENTREPGVDMNEMALTTKVITVQGRLEREHIFSRTYVAGKTQEVSDFLYDAGTIALAGGEKLCELYVNNGGEFTERHARAAVEAGPSAMRTFSSYGGTYPEDGSLSAEVIQKWELDGLYTYYLFGNGSFDDEGVKTVIAEGLMGNLQEMEAYRRASEFRVILQNRLRLDLFSR